MVKGINTVSRKILANILIGWFLTPVMACFIAVGLFFAIHLHYLAP
jgi:phosphate/sulfate permease